MHVFAHPLPPSCTGGTPLFPLNRRHTYICPNSFLPTPYNTQAARAIRPPLVGACWSGLQAADIRSFMRRACICTSPLAQSAARPSRPPQLLLPSTACLPASPTLFNTLPPPPHAQVAQTLLNLMSAPPPLRHTQAARPLRLLQLLPKTACPPRPPSSTCPSHQQHHNHHNHPNGTPLPALTPQPRAQALHLCTRARSACL